ncbi:MAG: Mth938-like domain-containing protein [Gammaproteobacteria bacterium]|nr:MAG: Mth938-like domain-containing protein [Gammaproteobacteria bacterium]
MKLHLDKPGAGKYLIDAYAHGQITINQTVYRSSLILTPDQINTDWPPASVGELETGHFDQLLQYNPEVIILGIGKRNRLLPPALIKTLITANIGFEIMDTAAACRTFNILAAEARTVVAGLMMISKE